MNNNNKLALIIVDVQPDFCEGGALGVKGGNSVAKGVAHFVQNNTGILDLIVTTQDWHIDPDNHFEEWPVHCVAGTDGAQLHPEIEGAIWNFPKTLHVRKGLFSDAYSGFEGKTTEGLTLAEALHSEGITNILIVGIATDYCVKATALDGIKNGFNVTVGKDLCAGVEKIQSERAIEEMENEGITIL